MAHGMPESWRTGLDTDEFRVFRVDEAGGIEPASTLVTLVATESVWLPDETSATQLLLNRARP